MSMCSLLLLALDRGGSYRISGADAWSFQDGGWMELPGYGGGRGHAQGIGEGGGTHAQWRRVGGIDDDERCVMAGGHGAAVDGEWMG